MSNNDLEQSAIMRIQMASRMSLNYYGEPLICTYSGGKDSDVMLHLFEISGIPFEVQNSHTTVDAPETVYHIRDTFHRLEDKSIKCTINYHVQPDGTRMTMWKLIPKKLMPPTRIARYCCSELKENDCMNRMIATGIRWDESIKRRDRNEFEIIGKTKKDAIRVSSEKMLLSDQDEDARQIFERCQLKAKSVVNPIIDWNEKDIWEYIQSEKIPYNPLYECGYKRVGCIGCPMARRKERIRHFARYPKYEQAYINAFGRMLDVAKNKGIKTSWKDKFDVFEWWMENPNIPGQASIFDMIDEDGNIKYFGAGGENEDMDKGIE